MSRENRLRYEKSPYLLQHKDNPVEWYGWGPEAMMRAEKEDKPIFLSIGYSTCYWCHMMEKDSFEKDDVAAILNEHFISIKVDREERPDVDQLYMEAVVALTGRGGWPLSVFLTPTLDPFWGGTFFYRDDFKRILEQVHAAWQRDRERIMGAARTVRGFITEEAGPFPLHESKKQLVEKGFHQLVDAFDETYGGFGAAPKFPPSQQIAFLLQYALIAPERDRKRAMEICRKSLTAMACGGIYDHVGGGFHRYSVDQKWLVPHFEKMLYDNSLLAAVYVDAYQITREDLFRRTAFETFEYLLRDMRGPEGGFYCAEDAGEAGREGESYVWSLSELTGILSGQELSAFIDAFGISAEGNFEGNRSVLSLRMTPPGRSRDLVDAALMKLFEYRKEFRNPPRKDDKRLTSWNAMAISALCRGYQVLREDRYLEAARQCAAFVLEKLFRGGALLRRFRDGDSRFNGYLEDYAFFIEALLTLYESDFDEKHLGFALELQEIQDRQFHDEKSGAYFLSSSTDVPCRKKEFMDSATPSGNSVTLSNLMRLDTLFPDRGYRQRADDLLAAFGEDLSRHPAAFSKVLQALQFQLSGSRLIVLSGRAGDEGLCRLIECAQVECLPPRALAVASSPENSFIPVVEGKVLPGGQEAAIICEHQTCGAPITDLASFRERIMAK